MVDMVDGVDGAHGFDKVDGVEIHILENAIQLSTVHVTVITKHDLGNLPVSCFMVNLCSLVDNYCCLVWSIKVVVNPCSDVQTTH